ncbi:hypothetical protein [Flavitalea sp.]|nr:hypothetical protein [Flavitalea sp.]
MFVGVVTLIIFLFHDRLLYFLLGGDHLCALIGCSNTEQESKAANQPNPQAHPARLNLALLIGYAIITTKFNINLLEFLELQYRIP